MYTVCTNYLSVQNNSLHLLSRDPFIVEMKPPCDKYKYVCFAIKAAVSYPHLRDMRCSEVERESERAREREGMVKGEGRVGACWKSAASSHIWVPQKWQEWAVFRGR